jgi:hypothetical protein
MIRISRFVLSLGLLAVLFITSAGVVQAQTSWDIRINQVSTLETTSGMSLKIYFNVFDPSTGAPVLDAQPTSAQVTLLNTNTVSPGQVEKPDTPIYITLVLDSSGSMAAAAAKLRQAAIQALNESPSNAFFSVIQFDEVIKLLQDFTQNISLVTAAINQYQVNPKSTCLYDAAYTAVESLSKAPPGRRAVILFTDGRDEKGNGTPCSQHTYQDLVTFANQMQVPINTIGLSDYTSDINSAELQSMASSTGGFSAIGGQSDLATSFASIMNALKAQWMVNAEVYPIQGTNQASLTVVFANNQSLNASFSITSSNTYPGPPSPVSAEIAGLLFHPENSTYELQLSLTSPDLVSYIKVDIWDTNSGSKVAEFIFNSPEAANTFNFPTAQLTSGGSYELHILAVSKADNTPFALTRDSQGNTSTELVHAFTFNPSAASPQVQIQSVSQQANNLALTITTTNTGLIAGFSGWLIDQNTNTRVPNSDYTLPSLGTSNGTLMVPVDATKVPNGKYTLVVQVLGQNQQVYSSAQYTDIVYSGVRPSAFQTIWVALLAAPVLLGLIIAILLGLVGFFMYMTTRSKSLTGTPVLQGRLGEKLSDGRGGGSVLPLADQEPILTRGQPPASAGAPSVAAPVAPAPRAPAPSRPVATGREDHTMPAGVSEGATMIAQPAAAMATLTILRSPSDVVKQGRQVAITNLPFIIGRLEGDLLIQDANVSRRHAQITYDAANRTYWITDLNSSNGTRLNGAPLVPGQARPLADGASISLGPNVVVQFNLT